MEKTITEQLTSRIINELLQEKADALDSSDPPLHDQHVRDYQRWRDQQAPQIVYTRPSPEDIEDMMREVPVGGRFPGLERPDRFGWWTRERKRK